MPRTLFALAFVLGIAAAAIDSGLVNKDVQRQIDLSSHTPRHELVITVLNTGSAKSSGNYHLAFPAALAKHLSAVEASVDGAEKKWAVDAPTDGKKDTAYIKIELGSLNPDEQRVVTVNLVFTHLLKPLPKKIAQNDVQRLVYEDNHFFFSPYRTDAQKTTVKTATSVIESHSEEAPTAVRGSQIEYGPYTAKAAYSTSALRVHSENNTPFYAVTTLLKEIEVSFWGNVAVEEHYDLRHTGAELKGFFSRLEYQKAQGQAPGAIRSLKADILPGASDMYYRDVIGNISTSNFRESDDGAEFEMTPRFPIFGGWKTQFYLGYNLPLNKYLSKDNNGRYHLNITFGSPFEGVVVDDHTVRVILPEGSSNIKAAIPFPVDSQTEEKHFTYLDSQGRPVLVIRKANIVSDHDVFFQVSFDFTGIYIFHEPLLLFIGFFSLFLVRIVFSRLGLSSDESKRLKSE